MSGLYSIRVNDQYRIVFRFSNGKRELACCPDYRIPTHLGQSRLSGLPRPMRLTQAEQARRLGITLSRVHELIGGKCGVALATARLLAELFENSAEFSMNLQSKHDLSRAGSEMKKSKRRNPGQQRDGSADRWAQD
jgi:addiction module HigA family antidote